MRSPQGPWDLAEQPSGSGGIQFTLDGATGPEPDFPRRTTWRYDVTCASSASRVRTSGQFDQN